VTKKRHLTYGKIAAFVLIFFVVWSFQRLYFRPVFLNQFDGLLFEMLDSGTKLLIWICPTVWLLKRFKGETWLDLKEMFTNKPPWLMVVCYTIVIALIAYLVGIIYGEGFRLRSDFEPMMLIAPVLVAGITEELVFRGFILNSLLKKMKKLFAVAIDAVLFALIHYPIWIYFNFGVITILINSMFSILFSVLLSHSFLKTKNLLVPVGLHSFYNLLMLLFVI